MKGGVKHDTENEQRRCTLIKRFIEEDAGWIAYLNHQIDKELDKDPGEQNWDLIEEYQKALDEVCKGRFDPDPKIKEEKLNELRKLYHKAGKKKSLSTSPPRWIPWAAVACLLLVILGIPVTSAAINHISPIDVIRQWGKQLFSIPYDVPVKKGGITFVRHGDIKTYASLDELLEKEDLHILYPTWLPEDVCVEQIYCFEYEESIKLQFDFSDEKISYTIDSKTESEVYAGIMDDSLVIDGISVPAMSVEHEGEYYVYFEYGDLSYRIGTHNRNQMKGMIEGLHRRGK